MLTLKGRTCVFAGGTGAVGRGAALALAEGGMNVILATHNGASAVEIVKEAEGLPGKIIYSDAEHPKYNEPQNIIEDFGSIDVVISNTGAFDAVKPVDDITEEELMKKLKHQIIGAFGSVKRYLPALRKSKAPRIILMSSAGAQDGFQGENFCDSVARGAVISMTYALAKELAKDGITVNCIAKSGMVNDHPPMRPDNFDVATVAGSIPLGRIGTTENFGALVSYIASEEAGFVTGQVFNLSGGLHIG